MNSYEAEVITIMDEDTPEFFRSCKLVFVRPSDKKLLVSILFESCDQLRILDDLILIRHSFRSGEELNHLINLHNGGITFEVKDNYFTYSPCSYESNVIVDLSIVFEINDSLKSAFDDMIEIYTTNTH